MKRYIRSTTEVSDNLLKLKNIIEHSKDPEELDWFAHHPSDEIRIYVAKNPNISIKTMEFLAQDDEESKEVPYAMMRIGLDRDDVRLLSALANSWCDDVREQLVTETSNPEILKQFVFDENPDICRFVRSKLLNSQQKEFQRIFSKYGLSQDVIDKYGEWYWFWDQTMSNTDSDGTHPIDLDVVKKAYGDSYEGQFDELFSSSDWNKLTEICNKLRVKLPETYWAD